jgi:hypothetical protein
MVPKNAGIRESEGEKGIISEMVPKNAGSMELIPK